MQENNEITLSEIFAAVIRKWKTVVACGLILAILLGGYKFAALYKSATAEPSVSTIANSNLNPDDNYFANDKTEFDNILEDNYDKYQQLVKYTEESIYYNLDYSNCAKTTIDIYVIAENENTAKQVAIAIADKVANEDAAEFAKNTGINGTDGQYIRELVLCEAELGENEADVPVVSLSVVAADTKTSAVIAGNILDQLEQYYDLLKRDFGEFTTHSLAAGSGYFVNTDLLTYQNSVKSSITNAINAVDNAKKNVTGRAFILNEEEQAKEMSEETAENSQGVSLTAIAKSAVKMAVVGFILGAFFGCCIIFLQVIFKPTIFSSRQLVGKKIKFIGNAESVEYKGIKKLANNIAGDKEFCTDRQNRLAYIANCLSDIAKDKKIMVTGTVREDVANGFVKEIKEINPDCDIIYSGNLSTDPKAVTDLNECGGIIIVEQKNVSFTKDVYKLISRAKSFDKSIEGYVIL